MNPDPTGPNVGDLHREPWAAHARQWNRLGPPLRPCAEDLERLHATWRQSLGGPWPARGIRILALGVTPEIATFPWAHDFSLTAIDASDVMIHAVWPGNGPMRTAVHSDWLQMPFPAAAFDLVLSDCGLAPLSGAGQLTQLGRELRRVLHPGGRVVMRHFARATPAESVETVIQALADGQVTSFHELKLRLLMALPAGPAGVRLGDAWLQFQTLFPHRQALAERLGCTLETIATVDAYRDRDARYVFPSLHELAEAFTGFTLAAGVPGDYPMAGCCPVFCLTPKS